MKVIVDGYNLLRRVPALAAMERSGPGGMEAARNELLRRLAGYHHLSGNGVTVVFDGQSVGAVTRFDRRSGVTVLYSRQGETADAVIAGQAAREPGSTVVSSDREVQTAARNAGCRTVEVDRFWELVCEGIPRSRAPRAAPPGAAGAQTGGVAPGSGKAARGGVSGGSPGNAPRGGAKKGNPHRRSKAERRRELEQNLLERRLRGR